MTKYFYAFKYWSGLETTTGECPNIVLAGDLLRFPTKKERDEFVNNNHFAGAKLTPCHVLTAAEANKFKYAGSGGVKKAFSYHEIEDLRLTEKMTLKKFINKEN